MSPKTKVFENALQGEGFEKRRSSVFVWTGENEGFGKRLRHCSFDPCAGK